MKNHSLLKRAAAAALLSATIVVPAAVGLTAGTANARPIESPNCYNIAKAADSATYAANVARQQGDKKAEEDWSRIAERAHGNYSRHCLT